MQTCDAVVITFRLTHQWHPQESGCGLGDLHWRFFTECELGEPLAEILSVLNNKEHSETGGGHNQKGVELQKHWALIRMFALEEQSAPDFLFLFEAIQDVAILDSSNAPTAIEIFQIKKLERGEWSWSRLTNLTEPKTTTKARSTTKGTPKAKDISQSAVGKLYAAVHAFSTLKSTGRFISDAGCNIIMADGSNAATSLPVSLSDLPSEFVALLQSALATIPGVTATPDLSKLKIERIDIPANDPLPYTIGKVQQFLYSRSPKHAGQAQSLVEALLARIAPPSSKTDTYHTFEELISLHGFSKKDLLSAIGALETLPDYDAYVDQWLEMLRSEGMGIMETTRIRVEVTRIYRGQLLGAPLPQDKAIADACSTWLSGRSDPTELLPFFEEAHTFLHGLFPLVKRPCLLAHFALRAIEKCADQS